jgi:hypothetical protein
MPFKKGQISNPKGCPKGVHHRGRPSNTALKDLDKALSNYERKYGKSILQHFVDRARENDQVLIALAKKILPDKIENGDTYNRLILHLESGTKIKSVIDSTVENVEIGSNGENSLLQVTPGITHNGGNSEEIKTISE